jgi:hypothetical protein
MRAISRSCAVLISLLLATAPASALDIAPALGGSSWGAWTDFERVVLEFDDDDWAEFVDASAAEFLPTALGAGAADAGSLESLVTRLSQRN